MKSSSMEVWASISWVMTAVVVISAVISCAVFGVIEIPSGAYRKENVIVWPIVVGCVFTAIYSVLFSVVVRASTVAAINSRTTLALLLKKEARGDKESDT